MGDPTHQLHDFEPGIASNGLFWTVAIPESAIEVSPGSGEARLHADSIPVTDFHDLFSAVGAQAPPSGYPKPSHVSFDVTWSGRGERRQVRDTEFGFVGDYVTGPAQISFTASDDDGSVVFSSDPDGQYSPTPDQGGARMPAVGHERNGVFFS